MQRNKLNRLWYTKKAIHQRVLLLIPVNLRKFGYSFIVCLDDVFGAGIWCRAGIWGRHLSNALFGQNIGGNFKFS